MRSDIENIYLRKPININTKQISTTIIAKGGLTIAASLALARFSAVLFDKSQKQCNWNFVQRNANRAMRRNANI
jgi:hypothetical protein